MAQNTRGESPKAAYLGFIYVSLNEVVTPRLDYRFIKFNCITNRLRMLFSRFHNDDARSKVYRYNRIGVVFM